jgi:hypothetical protein
MKREAGRSWSGFDYHGQNGFLNMLMCLKWWRDAMEEASPDWEEAVDDVAWVLQQMQRFVVPLSLSPRIELRIDTAMATSRTSSVLPPPAPVPSQVRAEPKAARTAQKHL